MSESGLGANSFVVDLGTAPLGPVVVVNLRGGLGNQLFQYACGLAIVIDCGLPLRLAVDMVGMAATPREPEIEDVFDLEVERVSRQEMLRLLGRMRAPPQVRLLLEKPWFTWARGDRFLIEERVAEVPDLSAVSNEGIYLHGYWQSEQYFVRHAETIRKALRFSRPLHRISAEVARRIKARPSASLHVRRGDYFASAKARAVHGVCDLDYYLRAITRLNEDVPGLRWFAFSDEPEWVENVLRPYCTELEIVRHNQGKDSCYDMHLMSLCSHHVIANSSFSWWGAWLNASPDKIVIAPQRWFADGRDCRAVTPPAWLRL